MKRNQILEEITIYCRAEYAKIDHWVHDIHHVEGVVANGKKLTEMERLRSREAFLIEVACWLHDLGRVGETTGVSAAESSHAEVSYVMSKKLLANYSKQLGRESVYKILTAVREHSLPVLDHPENVVAQFLQDADRGVGIGPWGIYTMLAYHEVLDLPQVTSHASARERLDDVYKQLVAQHKVAEARRYVGYLVGWYYGAEKQDSSGVRVAPLHTQAAQLLYKRGIDEVEDFLERLS